MSWPRGTIVVCVDVAPRGEEGPRNRAHLAMLTEGAYYTIRGPSAHGDGGIYLMEIIWPPWRDGQEIAYCHSRFRKAESSHSESSSIRQEQQA